MAKEVIPVSDTVVACEGNGPVTGHPRVYLTFQNGAKEIVCPYCSRTFVKAEGAPAAPAH